MKLFLFVLIIFIVNCNAEIQTLHNVTIFGGGVINIYLKCEQVVNINELIIKPLSEDSLLYIDLVQNCTSSKIQCNIKGKRDICDLIQDTPFYGHGYESYNLNNSYSYDTKGIKTE